MDTPQISCIVKTASFLVSSGSLRIAELSWRIRPKKLLPHGESIGYDQSVSNLSCDAQCGFFQAMSGFLEAIIPSLTSRRGNVDNFGHKRTTNLWENESAWDITSPSWISHDTITADSSTNERFPEGHSEPRFGKFCNLPEQANYHSPRNENILNLDDRGRKYFAIPGR
jgi:hypothetical protein